MKFKDLLDCPPERIELFVAARIAGKAAADAKFEQKAAGTDIWIYIPERIAEDKAANVEFAISYAIRMSELRAS